MSAAVNTSRGNADQLDAVFGAETSLWGPDDVFREARKRHCYLVANMSTTRRGLATRHVSMARLQFGQGDYEDYPSSLVDSPQRFDPLPDIKAPVRLTRTLSRSIGSSPPKRTLTARTAPATAPIHAANPPDPTEKTLAQTDNSASEAKDVNSLAGGALAATVPDSALRPLPPSPSPLFHHTHSGIADSFPTGALSRLQNAPLSEGGCVTAATQPNQRPNSAQGFLSGGGAVHLAASGRPLPATISGTYTSQQPQHPYPTPPASPQVQQGGSGSGGIGGGSGSGASGSFKAAASGGIWTATSSLSSGPSSGGPGGGGPGGGGPGGGGPGGGGPGGGGPGSGGSTAKPMSPLSIALAAAEAARRGPAHVEQLLHDLFAPPSRPTSPLLSVSSATRRASLEQYRSAGEDYSRTSYRNKNIGITPRHTYTATSRDTSASTPSGTSTYTAGLLLPEVGPREKSSSSPQLPPGVTDVATPTGRWADPSAERPASRPTPNRGRGPPASPLGVVVPPSHLSSSEGGCSGGGALGPPSTPISGRPLSRLLSLSSPDATLSASLTSASSGPSASVPGTTSIVEHSPRAAEALQQPQAPAPSPPPIRPPPSLAVDYSEQSQPQPQPSSPNLRQRRVFVKVLSPHEKESTPSDFNRSLSLPGHTALTHPPQTSPTYTYPPPSSLAHRAACCSARASTTFGSILRRSSQQTLVASSSLRGAPLDGWCARVDSSSQAPGRMSAAGAVTGSGAVVIPLADARISMSGVASAGLRRPFGRSVSVVGLSTGMSGSGEVDGRSGGGVGDVNS